MTDIRDPTPAELSLMLADDIEAVCQALNVDVRRRTPRKLICYSPFAPDKMKLEVELAPIRGKWNDWSQARYGDALGLVAYVLGHHDPKGKAALRQAILWAKAHFGYGGAGFDHDAWVRRRAEAHKRAEAQAAQAKRELARNRKTAFNRWWAAPALQEGDVGWAYLKARGIDIRQLGRLPGAIHVSQAEEWRDDEGDVRHVGPCLMSAMTLPDGKFGSLHRTWIDPDRPGCKADLSQIYDKANARKMWPSSEGCAIRLWRGESGLSEKDARERDLIEDMVVCEGVEDGLSIALMTPEFRVVAAGSLGGLLSFVPPKHVRTVIVAADNDWSNPSAAQQLKRACIRLIDDFGKLVKVTRSPEGKDFNDLLRERD